MKVLVSCHYTCGTCGDISVTHSHSRRNVSCTSCGGQVNFEEVEHVYAREGKADPWQPISGEQNLKLLVLRMLPDPALASSGR